ncbi:MAG: flagellar hook basal-body protein [Proteobacteria bacterium]|nr:flagellar hook basal-body protein [Pseudomonadota bacterium]
MADLVESVTRILAQAQSRAEIAARNIANVNLPAYKRRVPFVVAVTADVSGAAAGPAVGEVPDLTPGKLVQTGNPYDLALTGGGLFVVRQEDGLRYTRAGRFNRRGDGRLVDAAGGVLQLAGGGDVVVNDPDFSVRPDGTIIAAGQPAGRIAVMEAALPQGLGVAGNAFVDAGAGLHPVAEVHLVQGAYEASNVSTGHEMVQLMQALRQAEAGQRVMLGYDDALGRAITAFGESVR